MKRKKVWKVVTSVILFILLLFVLVALAWAISLSFDRKALTSLPEFSLIPHQPTTFNYEVAWRNLDLLTLYGNTLFLTVVNTVISVFTAIMCGYAFSKGRFRGKNFWFIFMLAVMMIPFESRMIPLYLQYRNWGMLNTYFPLIFGSFAYVYGIFFARSNIDAIPDAIRESAYLDGAHEWTIFLRIILPLSMPLIATLSILQVLANWNSYLWPLVVIRSSSKQVISVGVAMFNAQQNAYYYGPRMAISVVSAVPLVCVFLFLQKYIVQSVALSGIKQ